MNYLVTTRTYSANTALTAGEIDAFLNSIETFTNVTKLNSDNIQDASLLGTNLTVGAVTGAKLNSNVADGVTVQLAAAVLSVITGSVGATQLALATVGPTNIAANAVTRAKLAAMGQQVTISSGSYAPDHNQQVPNLNLTITTTGRPVVVGMLCDGSGADGRLTGIQCGAGPTQLLRTTSGGGTVTINANTNFSGRVGPVTQLDTVDVVPAGTYTYSVTVTGGYTVPAGNPFFAYANNLLLYAYELS